MTSGLRKSLSSRALEYAGQRARIAAASARPRVRNHTFILSSLPPKLNTHQRAEALQRPTNGETQADIARTYGVDGTTIGPSPVASATIAAVLQSDGERVTRWLSANHLCA